MENVFRYFLLLTQLFIPHGALDVCDVSDSMRFDCFPEDTANENECLKRGCCWKATDNAQLSTPYCYYGTGNFGYMVTSKKDTDLGFQLTLSLKGPGGPYGDNINELLVDFNFETKSRLRVKITDANNDRYEVPIESPKVSTKTNGPYFKVNYTTFPFGFSVVRNSDNAKIFNTNVGGFVFSDQFLQISSLLPSHNIYGLGEHILGFKLDTKWTKLSLFARDTPTPKGGVNLYGVHPFYLNVENNGNANGVYLKNSNAMDVILQPTPAITYRTIGGILDFYIFTGPTPSDVVQQYSKVIGKPTMPPYWALGFHLCAWGYQTLDIMETVRSRMKANGIPQDVQWIDIDYMDSNLDFTIDQRRFHDLPNFVDYLHSEGMRFLLLVDPAIANTFQSYEPYEDGLASDIFIKDESGNYLVGKVWPGYTVFPDFYHRNISFYWYNQINAFHKKLSFDGVWIDMNEPSSFVEGSTKGCSKNKYDNPPYMPGIIDGQLASKTICMSAQQFIGKHYDLHSLYGHSEAVATMSALKKMYGKRTMLMTRSTFPGTGSHAGHWLGDNHSLWEYMYLSIAGVLNFNLFAIPLVGADICGFIGDTTEELCSRWMQLGAFYPFSRNQNSIGNIVFYQYLNNFQKIHLQDQDPAAFGEQLITASKGALKERYRLLPYLYTLFYEAHVEGRTVARPLFFEFPTDNITYANDRQFMWGSGLLISPVLTQGATEVSAWFPSNRWYDYYTGEILDSIGQYVNLPASFEKVNLHVRAGVIIPMQQPGLTTTQTRKTPYSLLVALDTSGEANGYLYIDDGESFIDETGENTTLIQLQCSSGKLTTHVMRGGGYIPLNQQLVNVTIMGVSNNINKVELNGETQKFVYDNKYKKLVITLSGASIVSENAVTWSW